MSYTIRAYTWHKYRVYVDVQALQVSLLGGRVFFKGFRYHGHNETVLIHDGYITWRYWLRRVRQVQCDPSTRGAHGSPGMDNVRTENTEAGDCSALRSLPCRIVVKTRGLEWFIYNRSPAYDAILRSMSNEDVLDETASGVKPNDPKFTTSDAGKGESKGTDEVSAETKLAGAISNDTNGQESDSIFTPLSSQSSMRRDSDSTPPPPRVLQLLPIRIDCNKGAVVMGNQNARSILTAKFDSATGHLEARDSRSVDQYKQVVDFEFTHPIIQFKSNKDFKEDQISEGARHRSEYGQSAISSGHYFGSFKSWIRERGLRVWGSFRVRFPLLGGSVNSLAQDHLKSTHGHRRPGNDAAMLGQSRWLGLTRYLDDDDELVEQERWKAIEYGQFPTIVDSPKIGMTLYWDVPGLVPVSNNPVHRQFEQVVEDINGDSPPDWGVDLRIFGGNIRYGPWADRQRADLQAIFFPSLHKDAIPAEMLRPGAPRMSTVFKVVIEIEDQTTLGIPTREESKDWKWKGRETKRGGVESKQKGGRGQHKTKKEKKEEPTPDIRSFGWLDVKVSTNSTLSFSMDLVAKRNGFSSRVDLDLCKPEISTSVNHGLLWRSKSHKISCDLSYPLKWNALHPWHIDIQGDEPELFILRDHIFLLTDLVSDWASGPPEDFHTFVPYRYVLHLHFRDCKIFINSNDSNIINNPSDVDDNTFIVLWGKELAVNVKIPLTSFRPTRNQIVFDADAHDGGMKLFTPTWNTYHTFLDKPDIAVLKDLNLNGSYDYFGSTLPGLTDVMLLDIRGVALNIHLYGFLVRYLIKIKDNYFGEDLHFRTVEEYQEQMIRMEKSEGAAVTADHSRLSNDLDVVLGVTVEDSCVILPSHIYSAAENIDMEISSIGLDLRVTNYYMDLTITFSPIAISRASHIKRPEVAAKSDQNTQIFIDGLQLFGHRLFGLPPAEPTYVCNWDFDVGSISGEVCPEFLNRLILALSCFGFVFEDAENASPCSHLQIIHDITFLRVKLQPVSLWLRLEQAAFLLSLKEAKILYNDLAGPLFSERLDFGVPNVTIAIVDAGGMLLDPKSLKSSLTTAAYFETMIDVKMVKCKLQSIENRQLQQSHISHQDSRSRRIPWLIQERALSESLHLRTKFNPPAMPFPSMPEPVFGAAESLVGFSTTSSSSMNTRTSKFDRLRKGTFLGRASLRQYSARRKYSGKGLLHLYKEPGVGQSALRISNSNSPRKPENFQYSEPHNRADWQPSSNPDGEVRHPGKIRARPDFSFSSAYKKPYFPLSETRLDLGAVPMLPSKPSADLNESVITAFETHEIENMNQDTEHISLLIHLGSGFRAFCTPVAFLRTKELLARMQFNDPVTLLDKLQIDSMTEVLKSIERHEGHRKIVEIRLTIPSLEARVMNSPVHGHSGIPLQHQYQFSLEHLLAVARSSESSTDQKNNLASHQSSASVVLGQANISAGEVQEASEERTIIQVSVSNLVAWIFAGPASAVDIKFRDIDIISASREATSLVSLFRHTSNLSQDIIKAFSMRTDEQTPRLRLLVLFLTAKGGDVPDPPFLTKASYALRSVSTHPRTVDSWKMMSRLRYVYKLLPGHLQNELTAQSTQEFLVCPDDAENQVIASFERWRAWDMVHVRQSHLMQKVYPSLIDPPHKELDRPVPLNASIKAGNIRLLIEPGPNKSELVLEGLVAHIAMNQAWLVNAHEPSDHKGFVVQIYCDKTGLDINWDLCQYFEEIVALFTASVADLPREKYHANPSAGSQRLHVIISSGTNFLSLKSINLELSSVCRGFKTSVILDPVLQNPDSSINALMTINAVTSRLESHSRLLLRSELHGPSMSGSISNHGTKNDAKISWNFACLCDDLVFEILGDPLSLLEIIAIILRDEVAYVTALTQRLRPASKPEQSSQARQGDIWQANLSLQLASYLVSFAILPSLMYSMSGKAVQAFMETGRRDGSRGLLELDLNDHSHIFTMRDRDYYDDIATLRIPPINSHVVIDLSSGQKCIALQIMIEQIFLDASTIHALLATFSRPEIANLAKDVGHEFAHVKTVWEQEFPMTKSTPPSSPVVQDSVLYSVHTCLAGLVVRADAPKSAFIARPARLQLQTGCILLNATNRDYEEGQAMKFPELGVKLKDIKANLSKFNGNELLSCGDVRFGIILEIASKTSEEDELVRSYKVRIHGPTINLYAETASMVVDILGHLQDTLKKIDLSKEVRSLRRLTRAGLRSESRTSRSVPLDGEADKDTVSPALFNAIYSLEVNNVCITWIIAACIPMSPEREAEDLVLSVTRIDLATKRDNTARLLIEDFQIQMAPSSKVVPPSRSLNSALLPEVVFNVAYLSNAEDRRLAFQAAGKSLDLRLTSQFILPASDLRRSFAIAIEDVRKSTASWNAARKQDDSHGRKLLGEKRLGSLLIDADFAGAVVFIQGRSVSDPRSLALSVLRGKRSPQHGRYGQFTHENASSSTTLRAPGIALKVEYKDAGNDEPSLNAEVKVDASSNVLYPTIVPLIMEISSSVKEIVGESESNGQQTEQKVTSPRFLDDERLRTADPSVIFRHCRLNLGLRVCRQEFTLSCQPIARVAATACFETIYVTVNTVQSVEKEQFFTLSATFNHLQASVQHVYSRESTGSFDVDSIVLTLMNSKHVSTANGLSAILNICPMKSQVNAKQLHDFLLFREIWVPPDLRHPSTGPEATMSSEPQAFIVQRYQQVAAAGAFPWNATISIAELDVQLDLGQSLGKSAFIISNFWASSKKSSDLEQNLCLEFENVSVNSTGRMSGCIELQNFRVRTSIHWTAMEQAPSQAPLIQASLGFDHLRVKAAFDFQAFLIADITTFKFLMYNVRDTDQTRGDRLVGVLDGEKVQIFCTTTSASQGLALYQTIERLVQDKRAAYEASLKDIEKFLRRKSSINSSALRAAPRKRGPGETAKVVKAPLQLQTNVVVTLKAVNIGAFPSTFSDNQIFKLEALDASAHFAVILDNGKIHSTLGMTLGQLRVALSSVTRANSPKTLGEVSVDEVVSDANESRGGIVLKVPKLVASMQTWQTLDSSHIDYIFSSSFQGKVDVGWNYSRISFLRGMWATHTRALAQRWGKPLPPSALQITGGLSQYEVDGEHMQSKGGQEKITAVVNVPQSRYQYTALQPPIIETPQLRDMGEATPPLEWIGLQRERLPNLTHQIVIVSLLEVAKEVEDAYHRILGSS